MTNKVENYFKKIKLKDRQVVKIFGINVVFFVKKYSYLLQEHKKDKIKWSRKK